MPITIEGEDRFTSVIMLDEASVGLATPPNGGFNTDGGDPNYADLFHAQGDPTSVTDPTPKPIFGITFRNFTMKGSYQGVLHDHGAVRLSSFKNLRNVLFDRMVFTRSRAVMIAGDGVRGLTMRDCLLSQGRRGGMVISGAANVAVENNDFQWVADDPIAINASGPQGTGGVESFFFKYGASVRIIGNRLLGCRGLNVIGAKNVLIEGNIHILGHGRAIHVGVVTDEGKGDTTALNIVLRTNLILDLLDAQVDPQFEGGNGGHRAIDIELLNGKPSTLSSPPPSPNFIPGLPNGTEPVIEPTRYYYTIGQSGSLPTPHAANILLEGNVIARTRPPAVVSGTGMNPDHVAGFDNFESYGLGMYGGDDIGFANVQVPFDYITPSEGIAVTGAARNLTLRGNRIGGCDTAILFKGYDNAPPLPLLDVLVEQNDLSDWTLAGIRFTNYASQATQRVSILGNRGNGDPSHRNQFGIVRMAGGTWANVATGAFLDATGVALAMIAGNHIRNVSQLVAGFDAALHPMQDNVGYCDPKEVGWDAQNRGIGNLLRPQLGWRYIIEGSDPTVLADYGRILNPGPLASEMIRQLCT